MLKKKKKQCCNITGKKQNSAKQNNNKMNKSEKDKFQGQVRNCDKGPVLSEEKAKIT